VQEGQPSESSATAQPAAECDNGEHDGEEGPVSASADETSVGLEGASKTDEAWQDQALGLVHEGDRYEYGFGSDYYGIWDKQAGGPPIERYPATDEGRAQGWARYVHLEPGAEGAQTGPSVPEWIANPPRKNRARKWVWLAAAVILVGGIVALVVTKSGGGGAEGASGGQAGAGSKATVTITVPTAVTGELQGQTFDPKGFDTLGPTIDAVWENANAKLTIHLENPRVGQTTTRENPLTEIVIQLVGQADFDSRHGECTVDFTQVDEDGLAGSFSCEGVPGEGGITLNGEGTFQATS
jgi:hypothetical protein